MNDKYPNDFNQYNYPKYHGDYLSHDNQELKTSQNLEVIERLFDEWDEADKNSSESFSLNDQDASALNYEPEAEENAIYQNPTSNEKSSSYNDSLNNVDATDSMDQTREIDSIDLDKLKALQAELHQLYDEPKQLEEGTSQSQSKGKTLTKATKQGIAFSNGSLTKTFLDCVVLCFVTASMGFAFIMNIINHI